MQAVASPVVPIIQAMPPQAVTLASAPAPKIVQVEAFLTPEECEHFKELGRLRGFSRAKLVGKTTGVDVTTEERTNVSCWLPHDTSPVTLAVVQRIANFVGLDPAQAEQIQLIYYQDSQYYLAHYDGWAIPDNPADYTEEQRITKARYMDPQGGQRILTTLCYLNSLPPGAGGETEFPRLFVGPQQPQQPHQPELLPQQQQMPPRETLKCFPQQGKLICFSNVIEGTNKLHPDSLHSGCPVRNVTDPATGMVIPAEKWAFNLWFREKSARR